ncbi:MAG: MAE_28990/MAE_18760 family HEPN-like nuclease [Sporomusaceae bacterium]|nr:MAE_28990/MAE_18760 family HEPN-like nuclease [Sporomusaceae bacterium]
MKIKSIEKLQDKIDKEMAWRKKELLNFRQLVQTNTDNQKTLIRAGIALLCGHFEGLIRMSSNYYVVFISCKKIPINQIKNSFIALKLKKKMMECSKTEKSSIHKTLFDKLDEIKDQFFEIKYSDEDLIIKTESNPSSERVREIMRTLGLDFSVFESKKHYIDSRLLAQRHKIVHGENLELSLEDFTETFDIIMEIMENYTKIIIEAAENETFKKCV